MDCALRFATGRQETTNFANETLELALAHTIPNKAEAAYRRQDQLEKRAKLMQQWATYVVSPGTREGRRRPNTKKECVTVPKSKGRPPSEATLEKKTHRRKCCVIAQNTYHS